MLHDDCPLGSDGYTRLMTKMEHVETLLEAYQVSNDRRLSRLEGITGNQILIGGIISAVVAGIVLALKVAFSGGGK